MHQVNIHTDPCLFAGGCQPRESVCGANPNFPMWGTVEDCPDIKREEWKECSIRDRVWTVVDQNPQNSCCPSAVIGAMMIIREIWGLLRVLLSQGSLYGRINGGRDQGASIDSALTEMMSAGVCPASVISPKVWQKTNWPQKWADHASKYRIVEAFDCPNFSSVASAVQRGIPVVFGVFWGSGGHAITAIGIKQIAGVWNLEFLNSWGESWGENGIGYLPETQCNGIKSFGAFAVRAVTVPSDEQADLPPLPAAPIKKTGPAPVDFSELP